LIVLTRNHLLDFYFIVRKTHCASAATACCRPLNALAQKSPRKANKLLRRRHFCLSRKLVKIGNEFGENYFALAGKPLSNYFSNRTANSSEVV